jgi:TonB family protein
MNIHAIGIFDANILERRVMSLMTKPREMRGLLRVGFAAVCVAVGVATCGSALALRLDVNEPPPATPATETTPAPKGPVRVAGGVAAGAKIGGENPTYPPDARKAHVEGTVVLRAVISTTGDINSLQVVSGPEALRASAIDAVRTWRYKPYLLNGEPTAVETTININFNLGG